MLPIHPVPPRSTIGGFPNPFSENTHARRIRPLAVRIPVGVDHYHPLGCAAHHAQGSAQWHGCLHGLLVPDALVRPGIAGVAGYAPAAAFGAGAIDAEPLAAADRRARVVL